MCDDRCPDCNTSISPYFSQELGEEAETDEETEEEHVVRLRRISKEVKADMDAGRYRHGQLRPEIRASTQPKRLALDKSNPSLIIDSIPHGCADWQKEIIGLMYSSTMSRRYTRDRPQYSDWEPEDKGQEKDGPKTTYWTQPIPDTKAAKPVSSPSEELRAKRRSQRKDL
jgi:hypothetical protein